MKLMRMLFIMLAVLASAAAVHATVVDKVIVVVDNEIITQGEVDRIIGPAYEQFKNKLSGQDLIKKIEEARQAVMGQLLEEKLILSEAKKQNIQIEEKDIKAKVDEARKKFPSNEIFEQALASQKLTIKDLKAKFKEQLMARKLIDQKVGSKIFITPAEVVDYYNKHINEFAKPEQIRLRNILIRPKENVHVEKTADLINEILKRLKAGEDFAELAKIYSEGPGAKEGGDMGYVGKGDLMPEIEKAVFNMKAGETSGVIRTKIGYHFFKVEDRKMPESVSVADARRSIEEAIWVGKMREKSRGWVEELRKHAYIAFK